MDGVRTASCVWGGMEEILPLRKNTWRPRWMRCSAVVLAASASTKSCAVRTCTSLRSVPILARLVS